MLCAHIDTVPRRGPDRGRARRRRLPQPPRRDPRRRRQGRRRGPARACAPAGRARCARAAASSCSRPARRSGCAARARSTGPRSRRSSASCSTTPRRSAAWCVAAPDLLRTCMPSSWAARRTRASAPRTGAARSRPRPQAIGAMRLGPDRRGDDGERGRDPRRHGGERRTRALRDRGRGAQPRRRQGLGGACARMVDAITYAASADRDRRRHDGRGALPRLPDPRDHPAVALAAAALRDCGVEPVPTSTGGGSDASAFEAKGLPCVNLAIGVERNHTPHERVSRRRWRRRSTSPLRLVERAAGRDDLGAEAAARAGRLGGGGRRRGSCALTVDARGRRRAARRVAYPAPHRPGRGGRRGGRERRGARPRARQRRLRHRALQPHARARRRRAARRT